MKHRISLLVLCALSACKAQVNSELYLTDALKVAETGAAVSAPITVSIEIPSKDKCSEASDALTPIMREGFIKAEYTGCRVEGFDNWVDFNVTTEIVEEIVNDQYDSRLPLYFGVSKSEGGLELALYQNADTTDAMAKKLPENMRRFGANIDKITGSVELKNDADAPIRLEITGAFVDGSPVQLAEVFTVERRGSVRVVFSDVANASLASGGWATIGTIGQR